MKTVQQDLHDHDPSFPAVPPPPEPVPHTWGVIAGYRVDPEHASQSVLDVDSLEFIAPPGCLRCGKLYPDTGSCEPT